MLVKLEKGITNKDALDDCRKISERLPKISVKYGRPFNLLIISDDCGKFWTDWIIERFSKRI